METVTQIAKQQKANDDLYFFSTISIKGYSATELQGRTQRRAADCILDALDCSSIVREAEKLSATRDSIRLTFKIPCQARCAISQLAGALAQYNSEIQSANSPTFWRTKKNSLWQSKSHEIWWENRRILFNCEQWLTSHQSNERRPSINYKSSWPRWSHGYRSSSANSISLMHNLSKSLHKHHPNSSLDMWT